jgi:hypothetical protein
MLFEYFAVKNITLTELSLFSQHYERGIDKELGSVIAKITSLFP